MVLSKPDLLKRIEAGEVRFTPSVPASAIKQVSIDLRLGYGFTRFKISPHVGSIRISKELFLEGELWEQTEDHQFHTLRPGRFVLARTLERVTLPYDLMGLVEGRSSWARLGIGVHVTAPKIDPGYDNTITLELSNHSNTAIELAAERDVPCQLILIAVTTPLHPSEAYGGSSDDIFQAKG